MKKTSELVNRITPLNELKEQIRAEVRRGRPFPVSIVFVAGLLEAFLSGDISSEEISEYAEFLDVNDDIEFDDVVCADVVFRMSSPEINGDMTADRAADLLGELRRPST